MEILSYPVPAFFLYFIGGLFYLTAFIFIYIRVTPFAEFKMIRDGNVSSAITLAGAIIGFCLPLKRAIEQSMGFGDLTLWATVALITQIVTFLIFIKLLPKTLEKVEADQKSKAVLLAVLSVAIGMLNAACMTE